ncbi:MAG: hypothetical protein AABX14_04575 [Candidatus Aenigmatarchaeota archaeon]
MSVMKTKYKYRITKQIAKAMEDPEFRKGVKEFIRYHSGRS